MTAEIIIMNKEAVALAADSAATSESEKVSKIFTSSEKIFHLSMYHPVAIMISGNAEFMGVPWEIIIRLFRNEIKSEKEKTLEEYAVRFIKYLESKRCPVTSNDALTYSSKNIEDEISQLFYSIRENIRSKIDKKIRETGAVNVSENEEIISEFINDIYTNLANVDDDLVTNLTTEFKDVISKRINEIFDKQPIYGNLTDKLTKIVACFLAEIFSKDETEIVFTGYGDDDIFPSFKSYRLERISQSKLIIKKEGFTKISFGYNAHVESFAHHRMVQTFMKGIDPLILNSIKEMLKLAYQSFPEDILNNIKELSDERKEHYKKTVFQLSKGTTELCETLDNSIKVNFEDPVYNVVKILPKAELASMAESLVNLTSFKQRVSMAKEYVSGPIDVAIISKKDGFVWIKRKFYFTREFNPHCFGDYLEVKNDQQK